MARRHLASGILAAAFLAVTLPAAAQWDSQEITLHPGWNAVFIEVQPPDNRCEAIFEGVPVKSVWAWNERFEAAQYVRDPGDLRADQPDWLTYFPAGSQNDFLTSLYRIHGGKAYLIELGGNETVRLNLNGIIQVRTVTWLSDSFNLAGFHVAQEGGPTFDEFFAPSDAHHGQPIYRLNAEGRWQLIENPAETHIQHGQAYWIYCDGQSGYQGLIGIDVEFDRGLHFGRIMNERMLRIRNNSDKTKTVTLAPKPSNRPTWRPQGEAEAGEKPLAGEVTLAHRRVFSWEAIHEPLTITIEPKSTMGVPLAVLRADMPPPPTPGAVYETVLDVSDGEGMKFRIPVSAEKASNRAGLWVGTASVNMVSEAGTTGNLTTPTPTAAPFEFRLIIHCDGSATPQSTLLQQVYLMQVQEEVDDDGNVTEPSRYVLLTRDELVPTFEPVAMRDGELVGRRISSAAFAFPEEEDEDGNRTRPALELTGSFGTKLEGTITLPYDDPLNPFVHAFHPDHNNLNELYDEDNPLPEGVESYTFSRKLTLEFQEDNPFSSALPEWGEDVVGGVYKERIEGVHKNPIYVQGTFQLNRVLDVATLNDGMEP